jgi:exopolysaccharide biosynthesis polyprenyl glycosylphosphotransferase
MIRLFNVSIPSRTILLLVSDSALVTLALAASIWAWFQRDAVLAFGDEHGYVKILLASAACVLCMHYYDLYDSSVLTNPREVGARLIQALGTLCVVLAALYFAYPPIRISRGPLAIWLVVAGAGLLLWRKLFVTACKAKWLKQRTILLGTGPLHKLLCREIENRPELSLELVGYIEDTASDADGASRLRRLGSIGDLASVVERLDVDSVIVTMADRRGRLPVPALLKLKARGISIQDGSELYEAITGRLALDCLSIGSLLFSSNFRISRGTSLYKRASSAVLSLMGLILLLPVIAVIAVAIRLDSRGPIVFRQKRAGQDGKIFTLYKFRSMVPGADGRPAQENDERVTRVGRWLRKVRLDELPQLFNILRGDMSFVGPRPFLPEIDEECLEKIPGYAYRSLVKPGATGWAQIECGYCSTLEENKERLSYDLYYIKHVSIGLDLMIAFQTAKILVLGRGAR